MDGLYNATGLSYMANLYLTPAGSQGFVDHTDNKDGFILQACERAAALEPGSPCAPLRKLR